MSAKKREIYARAAVQLRSHERPAVAESLCPGAMGLYFFLLVQARGEGSDGDVAEVIAFASWGAPVAYRKKQAEALVSAGLIERRDGRLWIVRYAEHNDDASAIRANRDASAERQRSHRKSKGDNAPVTRDTHVTNALVTISSSISNSGSDLSGSERPTSTPRADEAAGSGPLPVPEPTAPPEGVTSPPDWWPGAVAAAEHAVGPIDQPEARWLEYDAARERRGWARSHRDAVGWLTSVRRSERTREAERPKSFVRGRVADTRQPMRDQNPEWLRRAAAGENDL